MILSNKFFVRYMLWMFSPSLWIDYSFPVGIFGKISFDFDELQLTTFFFLLCLMLSVSLLRNFHFALGSCSVTQLCLTLCNPMDCSMPSFSVHRQLGVYSNSCPLSRWCHPTISSSVVPFSFRLQSVPASGSFLMSQLFASGGQSIGVSASTSVLPMNIQDWIPLELTGLISLLSRRLSRVFSGTTVWKHLFFGAQLSLWSK